MRFQERDVGTQRSGEEESRAAGRRSRDLKPNWSTRDTLNRVLSGEQLEHQRVIPRNNYC